ncbi:hypothetical protein [Streptomyces sp. NPDC008092]|uniref:hypothetical protein n=1 Tax=Streptomyces sp. NPDC008092 TaxID=3364808 RepID=UPI0036EBEAED
MTSPSRLVRDERPTAPGTRWGIAGPFGVSMALVCLRPATRSPERLAQALGEG